MAQSRSARIDRRRFLGDAVRAGIGLGAAALWPGLAAGGGPTNRPGRSVVARAFSPRASDGRLLRVDIFREMIEKGLAAITGKDQPKAAWDSLLGAPPRILLKFQAVGADALGTSPTMAKALAESLVAAGFARDTMYACELDEGTIHTLGLQPAPFGCTQQEVDFGSGRDQLHEWALTAPAIINVPFLSDDRICGLACSIKNIAYSAVKHPSRMHEQRCDPQLADICALPQMRSRVKLHICNAVRAICDGGPADGREWPYRSILLSTDPVALDSVALEAVELKQLGLGVSSRKSGASALSAIRARAGYLAAAAARGLGQADPDHIQVVSIRV